jgi:hypothetical protein
MNVLRLKPNVKAVQDTCSEADSQGRVSVKKVNLRMSKWIWRECVNDNDATLHVSLKMSAGVQWKDSAYRVLS